MQIPRSFFYRLFRDVNFGTFFWHKQLAHWWLYKFSLKCRTSIMIFLSLSHSLSALYSPRMSWPEWLLARFCPSPWLRVPFQLYDSPIDPSSMQLGTFFSPKWMDSVYTYATSMFIHTRIQCVCTLCPTIGLFIIWIQNLTIPRKRLFVTDCRISTGIHACHY